MNENVIIPGIYTSFTDLSQELKVLNTGNVSTIIGPTAKGPINIPTFIESYVDFINIFGDIGADENLFVPYAVKYNSNFGSSLVIRTGFTNGVGLDNTKHNIAYVGFESDSINYPIMMLEINEPLLEDSDDISLDSSNIQIITESGQFIISTSFDEDLFGSLSTIESDENYITKVIGNNNKIVLKHVFNDNIAIFNGIDIDDQDITLLDSGNYFTINSGSINYSNASTPKIVNVNNEELFTIKTIGDGYDVNKSYKIEISNIVAATSTKYPSFDILVRDFNDTEDRKIILERFTKLNLNPDSDFYIGKQIGDGKYTFKFHNNQYRAVYDGIYANRSKYIYINISSNVNNKNFDKSVLYPVGFSAYNYTTKFDSDNVEIPNISLSGINSTALVSTASVYGLDVTSSNSLYYLDAIGQDDIIADEVNNSFNMYNYTGVNAAALLKGFIVGFQGGQNGGHRLQKHITNASLTQGYNFSDSDSLDVQLYENIFDMLKNNFEYTFQTLIVPGVNLTDHEDGLIASLNTFVTCTERKGDFKVLIDAGNILDAEYTNAIDAVANIDNEYMIAYYPWIYVKNGSKYIKVPAVCDEISVFSKIKSRFKVFNPPAGYTYGVLDNAVKPTIKLSPADVKQLYASRINSIITKTANNLVINYSQKTLFDDSPYEVAKFSNIFVMNTLIDLSNTFKRIGDSFLFRTNNVNVRSTFREILDGEIKILYMAGGLNSYRVICDTTNNTPEIIKQNKMVAEVYLQFNGIAEFIYIPFYIEATEE